MALPIGDLVRTERRPFVTAGLVVANALVWLAYQLPAGIDHSVRTVGFRACGVDGSCADRGLPWPAEAMTSMFGHASWSHLVGNMVFLVAFGPLVESRLGHLRYLALYLAAGVAAAALQASAMLAFTPHEATVPMIGASGAISGVVAAYIVIQPFQRVLVWVLPTFFLRVPAIALLGVWFLLQALEASLSVSTPDANAGVAFFAHVGGFLAGLAAATLLVRDAWTRRIGHAGGGPAPA